MQETQVTEELDLSFVQTPHEVLKRLREAGPAVKVMLPNGSLVWIVTRYEEVRQALSEPKLSKSFKGLNELMARHTKEGMAPSSTTRRSSATCSPATRRTTPGCAGW